MSRKHNDGNHGAMYKLLPNTQTGQPPVAPKKKASSEEPENQFDNLLMKSDIGNLLERCSKEAI